MLADGGQTIDEALMRHLSPLAMGEHINLDRRLRLATKQAGGNG